MRDQGLQFGRALSGAETIGKAALVLSVNRFNSAAPSQARRPEVACCTCSVLMALQFGRALSGAETS